MGCLNSKPSTYQGTGYRTGTSQGAYDGHRHPQQQQFGPQYGLSEAEVWIIQNLQHAGIAQPDPATVRNTLNHYRDPDASLDALLAHFGVARGSRQQPQTVGPPHKLGGDGGPGGRAETEEEKRARLAAAAEQRHAQTQGKGVSARGAQRLHQYQTTRHKGENELSQSKAQQLALGWQG